MTANSVVVKLVLPSLREVPTAIFRKATFQRIAEHLAERYEWPEVPRLFRNCEQLPGDKTPLDVNLADDDVVLVTLSLDAFEEATGG